MEARPVDKILGNSFNTGTIEYEAFVGEMRVDPRVSSQYDDQLSDDLIEVRNAKMLESEIYELFKVSPFYIKYKEPKPLDKNDRIKMYYYFKERLVKLMRYSTTDIFISFCEFFQMNYDTMYTEIGTLDKEDLLKFITQKYNLSHRITSKKLF